MLVFHFMFFCCWIFKKKMVQVNVGWLYKSELNSCSSVTIFPSVNKTPVRVKRPIMTIRLISHFTTAFTWVLVWSQSYRKKQPHWSVQNEMDFAGTNIWIVICLIKFHSRQQIANGYKTYNNYVFVVIRFLLEVKWSEYI